MADATFLWKVARLGQIASSHLRFDDDFSDRLNYQFTGLLLFLFIGLTGIRQYVGKPIQCWIPQEFTRGWEEYSENYCWVANTYFVPQSKPQIVLAHDKGNDSQRMITYYQWVPLVMGCQALLFYFPCLIWRLFNTYSAFSVQRTIQMGLDANIMHPDVLRRNIRSMGRYLETCILRQREWHRDNNCPRRCKGLFLRCSCGICCGRQHGNYLVALYFTMKFFYLFNAFGQLFLMEHFIGTQHLFFGINVLIDLMRGQDWTESGHFPRVTFCLVETRKLGDNHKYTIQCVLPLNMFLEKIYIFLWLWFLVVGLITFANTVNWFLRLAFYRNRLHFIRKYIKIYANFRDSDKELIAHFVENFLRLDGVFLLKLVALNCGDLVTGDLIAELWQNYCNRKFIDEVEVLSGENHKRKSSYIYSTRDDSIV